MKNLQLLFVFLWISYSAMGQDRIIKTDKSELKSKVQEITDAVIKYKQFDFLDGPTYNIKKSEVYMVIYQNGKHETFTNMPENAKTDNPQVLDKAVLNSNQEAISNPSSETGINIPARTIVGIIYTNQIKYADFTTLSIYGFKLGYEKVKHKKAPSAKANPAKNGYGLTSYNYFGYSEEVLSNNYTASRHYVTAYLFKEKSIKNIITIGGLLGAGGCLTRATISDDSATNPGESDGNLSGGGNIGLYLQKSLFPDNSSTGKQGAYLRLGYDVFLMTDYNLTAGINLSMGF